MERVVDDLKTTTGQSLDDCVDSTVAESATVDYLTTIVQNSLEDSTIDDIVNVTT